MRSVRHEIVPGLLGHVDIEVGRGEADIFEGERAVSVTRIHDLIEPAERVSHVARRTPR